MSFDMKPSEKQENGNHPFLDDHTPIDDPTPKRDEVDTAPHPHAAIGKALARWQASEYGYERLEGRAYIFVVFLFILVIAYAIYTNSPLMAIVFILIGMIGYLSMNRVPETVLFSITTKGVTAGKEFYEFDHLKSFWIIEDHPDIPKELIIETGGSLVSHIFIPLAEQNTDAIRSILIASLPERKYEPGLIDILGRILHI
jgi:hypothetical protein